MDELKDLYKRLEIVRIAIRIIESSDDPRKEEALTHYLNQKNNIEKRIRNLTPPNIVVSVNSADMSATPQK